MGSGVVVGVGDESVCLCVIFCVFLPAPCCETCMPQCCLATQHTSTPAALLGHPTLQSAGLQACQTAMAHAAVEQEMAAAAAAAEDVAQGGSGGREDVVGSWQLLLDNPMQDMREALGLGGHALGLQGLLGTVGSAEGPQAGATGVPSTLPHPHLLPQGGVGGVCSVMGGGSHTPHASYFPGVVTPLEAKLRDAYRTALREVRARYEVAQASAAATHSREMQEQVCDSV